MLLTVENLTKRFGDRVALSSVSFRLAAGAAMGIVGQNGSGKTTALNVLSRFVDTDHGHVTYNGRDLLSFSAAAAARAGIARVFQAPTLIGTLTLGENLLLATRHLRSTSPNAVRRELDAVGLEDKVLAPVVDLSYFEVRKAEFARAMIAGPALLLLDEPVAGLADHERAELLALVRASRNRGFGMLVVEHDLSFVGDLCDDVIVLDHGQVIARGTPETIESDEGVALSFTSSSAKDRDVGAVVAANRVSETNAHR